MNKQNRKGRIMTTLELKTQIKKDIDNEKDSAILKKLQTYYRKLKNAQKNMPCQYSLIELNNRLDKAEKEAENGGGVEHDEFKAEVETWF